MNRGKAANAQLLLVVHVAVASRIPTGRSLKMRRLIVAVSASAIAIQTPPASKKKSTPPITAKIQKSSTFPQPPFSLFDGG
jgi:hypothetical protein